METYAKENYWSKFADDFEIRNTYVVGKNNIEIIHNELRNLSYFGKTLELGCGDGAFTKVIVNKTTEIIATDFSDEMVNSARLKLQHYKKIKVQKQNCFNLTFEDETFDTVFMANLLHIIPNPEILLKECNRILKKNGSIVVLSYTNDGIGLFDKLSMMYRYVKSYGFPSKTAYKLTCDMANEMAVKQGFNVKLCKLVGHNLKAVLMKARKI